MFNYGNGRASIISRPTLGDLDVWSQTILGKFVYGIGVKHVAFIL